MFDRIATQYLPHTAALPFELRRIRVFIWIGIILICAFMVADIGLLPQSLHSSYIFSRIGVQVPLCLSLFVLSFVSTFPRMYHLAVISTLLCVTWANLGFIAYAWQQQAISFPYEGTFLYSFYTMLILRVNLRFSVIFSLLVLASFSLVVGYFDIYGESTFINIGFVFAALFVSVMGVYQIENAQQKLLVLNDKLSDLSQRDSLTGLFNRRTYNTLFNQSLRHIQREDKMVCVYIIDLDNFKGYNDCYGHVKGDHVIQCQADYLQQIFKRKTDIVARFGGEEFIVAVFDTDAQQCVQLAQQIVDSWQLKTIPHKMNQSIGYVTCSVGYCLMPAREVELSEALINKADKALYKAKDDGRNTFCMYSSSIS